MTGSAAAVLVLLALLPLAQAGDAPPAWKRVGDGAQATEVQEADLQTGTIRNEVHHRFDGASDAIRQEISFAPFAEGDVMGNDESKRVGILSVMIRKGADLPYAYDLLGTVPGYALMLRSTDPGHPTALNAILFELPLMQAPEVRLVMAHGRFEFAP